MAAAFWVAAMAWGQWSFTLDTTFRAAIVDKNVNALHLLPDGGIFLSGRIRFAGDLSDRGSAKLLPDGSRDMSFPAFPQTTGGGKIIPWGSAFYVLPAATVRRMTPDGLIDPTFVSTNASPYFLSGSGGDFHVFPDGRVLLSGTHILSDSIRGFEGSYELIWITNTGYLDTTRVHRNANGPIWAFKELPDGKFICSCSCTQYEGQPVSRLFRVHADGALDTTFQAGVNWGNIFAYHGLPDGRVYAAGRYKRAVAPNDTLFLARFLPDGSLDPTFTPPSITMGGLAADYGPGISCLHPWAGGLLAGGEFGSVNQVTRESIFIVDSTGVLTSAFDGFQVGVYAGQFGNSAEITSIVEHTSDTLYICGAYIGLNDGTTNDPQQRFVSRLLVSELSTGAGQPQAVPAPKFAAYPNPARHEVTLTYELAGSTDGQGRIVVRDLTGRPVAQLPMNGTEGRQTWNVQAVAPGTYVVEYLAGTTLLHSERLVVE